MSDHILRADALSSRGEGFALRVALPWIRSLPIACLMLPKVVVDGEAIEGLRVELGARLLEIEEVAQSQSWWFMQDRVVLVGPRRLAPGPHLASVSFSLAIPYFPMQGDKPFTAGYRSEQTLWLNGPETAATVSRDVA